MPFENGQKEMEILCHDVGGCDTAILSVPIAYQGTSKEIVIGKLKSLVFIVSQFRAHA